MGTIQIERLRGLERVDEAAGLFDAYRQFYGRAPDRPGAREFLRQRLEGGESAVFVAYAQDGQRAPVGFMQLYPCFSSISMERAWILNDLFVTPEHRRHAVARGLLQAAVAFARKSGARGLTLKTAQTNLPAQKLYESLGWQRDNEYFSYDLRCDEEFPTVS